MQDQTKQANPAAPAAPVAAKPVKFINKNVDESPTYHADGGWGIANQHGNIRVSFYTENQPTPTAVIHGVNANGDFTGENELEGMADANHFLMVRSFQCNVVLPLTSAVQVHQMLGNFIRIAQEQMQAGIKELEKQQKQAEQIKSGQLAK